MKRINIYQILFLLLLIAALPTYSQGNKQILNRIAADFDAYTESEFRASIYLATSKDIYETAEDMWFKATILDAQDLTLFDMDKTLYLRLVKADNDSVVWREKYLIKNGIASGHVFLDNALPEGNYHLSAYTAHSLYQNTTYYPSYKIIRIIKDFRSLSADRSVAVMNDLKSTQDIQFTMFPEGGQLVSGILNTVAFKAVDRSGAPIDITGELLEDNVPVKTLKSVHAGMGAFRFKPLFGKIYRVRLKNLNSDLYTLPAIRERGVVLHLLKRGKDSLTFSILQNPGSLKQPVFVRIQMRGRTQAVASGLLTDSLKIKIPTINLSQGIAEATVLDHQMRPLAERLIYLNPDKIVNVAVDLSKKSYKKREKISLKIKTTDYDGKPIQASIGISVFDNLYRNLDDSKNILTHFYLSAQLKGKIYDPGYYFDQDNKDRLEALDMLLLTQGWRCYLWNIEELKDFTTNRQVLSDNIDGKITPLNVKNSIKAQTLMAFSIDESEKRFIVTDTTGKFSLAPEDVVKGRWSYLKRFNADKEEYSVSIDDPFRKINDAFKKVQHDYKIAHIFNISKNDFDPERINNGTIQLDEVSLFARNRRQFRDKYMGRLDSLAKLEGNTDFVYANSNWLNVPVGGTGTRPVEGREYTVWVGPNRPTRVPFDFGRGDFDIITYHYPTFTEEELLKKYKLTRLKGYYEKREFYQPDYDKEADPLPDNRNTLIWLPEVITDANGEASINFFSSDISSNFTGIIEGVSSEGFLGRKEILFKIMK